MRLEIEAMRAVLLDAVSDLGGLAQNLKEADEWATDDREEEAALSLEAAATGAADAMEKLRAIALKCEELCAGVKA